MLQAGGPRAYTRTSRAIKGARADRHAALYVTLRQSTQRRNMEAWYRMADRARASEQRHNGIFPPVDVVQVLPGGVHAVLPLTSPLEVFCT